MGSGTIKIPYNYCRFHSSAQRCDFLAKLWISCEIMDFHEFYGNQWIPRNYLEFQKFSVSHKSVTLHETLVFLGQIDGPAPWDSQNQQITRIPWNSIQIDFFQDIMPTSGDFRRILGEMNFGRLGGVLAAPRWKRWYSYRNIDGFEVPGTTQIT